MKQQGLLNLPVYAKARSVKCLSEPSAQGLVMRDHDPFPAHKRTFHHRKRKTEAEICYHFSRACGILEMC